jgi:hypothetical protein
MQNHNEITKSGDSFRRGSGGVFEQCRGIPAKTAKSFSFAGGPGALRVAE